MSVEREQDISRVKEVAAALGEHFDSVQIFCSRFDPEDSEQRTITTNQGTGNWLARYGQVREWIIYHDERIRQAASDDMEEKDE